MHVFISRIPLSSSEDISLSFKLKRKQFPVRLNFAMTINKTQGQTIPNVGIYLPESISPTDNYMLPYPEVFHVLLYGCCLNLTKTPTGRRTKNINFRDILQT